MLASECGLGCDLLKLCDEMGFSARASLRLWIGGRADSSKSVVRDDGRRKGPGPEALEAGVFALRVLGRWECGQPCPRVPGFRTISRGQGCPRSCPAVT